MFVRSGWLASWPALLVVPLLASAFLFDHAQVTRQHEQAHRQAVSVLGGLRGHIESHLNERLYFVRGLAGFVRIHPGMSGSDFEVMAKEIVAEMDGIRSVQLAPDAVITHVVPREGNEGAIGHDLMADPARRTSVEKAISSRSLVVAGPYPLRQGGEGVIGRMPIFVADGSGERFWGLAIIVIDMPTLYAAAGISEVVDGVRLAIRGRDGLGAKGELFFGQADILGAEAIRADINFPSGTWEILAIPEGGWPTSWHGRPVLATVTLVLCAAFLGLAFLLHRQTVRLQSTAETALFNEKRFRTLFDEALQMAGTTTPEGVLSGANRAACTLIGCRIEELLGQPLWLTPWWSHDPALAERVKDAVARAGGGETIRFECTHPRPDGSLADVDFSLKPLTDAHGRVIELLAEGRDVTERKRVEDATREREEFYKRMFQSNAAVKLLIDPSDGTIVDANTAAQAYYGYSHDQLLSMRIWDINVLGEAEIRAEMAAAREHKRSHFNFPHRLASGEIRQVEVFSGPVEIGRRQLLHSIVHDVTDRVRFEKELARSNADLEQFAYVASHDLRQPLRQVASFVSLLERRYADVLDDTGREFIAFAREGATRMDALIVDLLEYSRIGRSGQAEETIILAEVISEAVSHLSVAIAESGASLSVLIPDELPAIPGTRSELVRLVMNLVGNALKYRDPERTLDIRIAAMPTGEGIEMSVADNGIGIPPEQQEAAFKIFQRLNPEATEGTGIGLAVCRKIAEHHHGQIWVDSSPGQGSVFHVTLGG